MATNVQQPLQKNTVDLQGLLDAVNALPEVPALEFTAQPISVYVESLAYASFSVGAVGENVQYQWQYKTTAADAAWTNCPSSYSGYKSATMSVQAINARNNWTFRCIVSDGQDSITSEEASLTIHKLQTKTANANGTVSPDNGYYGLSSVVVNVPTPTPTYDTPSINVSTDGLITASANGKSNTQQLTAQEGKTVTPTKAQQTAVASQRFTTGNVLVAPIPNEYIIPTGSKEITENGNNIDVAAVSTVNVNVPTSGGGKNVQGYLGYASVSATSYTATAVKLTVAKTGTYKVSWMGWRSTNSGTSGSQLYINNSSYGSANTSFTNTYGQSVVLNNVSLTAGQEIVVRARARSTSYVMAVGNLIIEEV